MHINLQLITKINFQKLTCKVLQGGNTLAHREMFHLTSSATWHWSDDLHGGSWPVAPLQRARLLRGPTSHLVWNQQSFKCILYLFSVSGFYENCAYLYIFAANDRCAPFVPVCCMKISICRASGHIWLLSAAGSLSSGRLTGSSSPRFLLNNNHERKSDHFQHVLYKNLLHQEKTQDNKFAGFGQSMFQLSKFKISV